MKRRIDKGNSQNIFFNDKPKEIVKGVKTEGHQKLPNRVNKYRGRGILNRGHKQYKQLEVAQKI